MSARQPAGKAGHRFGWSVLVCGALLLAAGCDSSGEGSAGGTTTSRQTVSTTTAAPGNAANGVPETFFAVSEVGTRIVEVDVATGGVRRTVVDHGRHREPGPNTYIESLDLSPDGATLYYGTVYQPPTATIYRLTLPNGTPERLADGRGPSVSPDGRRLAFVLDTAVHVRDLATGEEQVFPDMTGEIGGGGTTWAADSSRIAFEQEGADVVVAQILDLGSGQPIELHPGAGLPSGYYAPYAYSPRFRATDGLLGVVCCGNPDPAPDDAKPSRLFILFDPASGAEKQRYELPFSASTSDYDRSGQHQLIAASDDVVYRLSPDGEPTKVGVVDGVSALAW